MKRRLLGTLFLSLTVTNCGDKESAAAPAAVPAEAENETSRAVLSKTDAVAAYLADLDSRRTTLERSFNAPTLGADLSREAVERRLQEMFDLDQLIRFAVVPPPESEFDDGQRDAITQVVGNQMGEVDQKHTEELQAFVGKHGWPKTSVYGQVAAQNAWLIAQHADQSPDFQQEALAEMKALGPEVQARHVAYLADRVATKTGKQLYGTQGKCVGKGKWEPNPVQDPKDLDKRRANIGLESMEEYKERFVDSCP